MMGRAALSRRVDDVTIGKSKGPLVGIKRFQSCTPLDRCFPFVERQSALRAGHIHRKFTGIHKKFTDGPSDAGNLGSKSEGSKNRIGPQYG